MKIIQIDGIKGLITAAFVCACAFAGFVISPGYVAMSLWNKYLVEAYMFPSLSLFQGVLLWAIMVISYFLISKKGFALSFKNTPEISDEEINSILRTAKINSKMKMINKMISESDKYIKSQDENLSQNVIKKEESFVSSPISSTDVEKEEHETSGVTNIK